MASPLDNQIIKSSDFKLSDFNWDSSSKLYLVSSGIKLAHFTIKKLLVCIKISLLAKFTNYTLSAGK